jgi:hypothetical protein
MKLDLRRPTIVLAGAWNPAIFEPAWIARHVFGMPGGVEFTVNAAQMIADGEAKLAIYIGDVGFSVSPTRLEIFAAQVGAAAFSAVESATAKIVELLPHTPISAYGINFRFIEELPSPDLLKQIRCHDELEKRFEVAKETIISTINLEPKVQLNLQRQKEGSSLFFNFNFHYSGVQIDNFTGSIRGEVQARLGEALSIMRDIYGLSSYEVLTHEFASGQGEQE